MLKRLSYTVVLVFMIIVVNWLIFEAIPGQNGAQALITASPRLAADPLAQERLCEQWDCHASLVGQFIAYVRHMLTFQFGESYQNGQSISTQIITQGRLVNTLWLLGVSLILSIIIGVVLGVVSSYERASVVDSLNVSSSIATTALPTFWVGLLLILVFAIGLGWFPSGGLQPAAWTVPGNLPNPLTQLLVRIQFFTLPLVTLTLISYGSFVLLTRATMMEVLTEDYVLTAKAKGLPQRVILFRHAFKNASLPVLTASALTFGGILAGAVITETVFAWPGLGFWLFQAVEEKDFPVMQAMFYLISLTVIAANFISDVLYGIVDPRIRYE